jgi:ATP-dependent exoDNAse (exonuclease V) beta subunit
VLFSSDRWSNILEKDVINGLGQTRRIDRLIVKKQELWIVDYKSSRDGREKFLEQVKEYIKIVSDIESGKTVRGFLIYLDDASFEEVI